ncbi:MAG TPA: NADH-quinone oxidoreductase subunit NuoF [Nitrospirota bacterium]|nr:NADH-quinone oxidoreductase subunit NuoF [Nitrospirota bacterium]
MERPLTQHINPGKEPLSLKDYEKAGGYQSVRKALAMTPQDVQNVVKASNLRGRGGAGFPTGAKWSFVPMGPEARRPKYFVVNADEMEPGTFKDRLLLEGNPHQLIEGVIASAYAIEAEQAIVFVRWAYKLATRRLNQAIADAYENGYLGKNILGSGYSLDVRLHGSAGRYICGEETALLNALEGRRATPRAKPPFPQVCGLFGKPTIVNNVETVSNIPHIVQNGPDWYKGLSKIADTGTKLYGASGRVRKPGIWELPMGVTVRELLEEHAGGMQKGYQFRGVIPGGASTDFLVSEHLDVKMDFDSVMKAGSRLGTGTMIVLDDKTCPVGFVHNLIKFFARESCGWCTPCRDGLPWIEKILRAMENGQGEPGDIDILAQQCRLLGPGNTYCALAPGAVEPLQSAIKYFREDFERHIKEKKCPWK